jgi:hypothetical protein
MGFSILCTTNTRLPLVVAAIPLEIMQDILSTLPAKEVLPAFGTFLVIREMEDLQSSVAS